MEIDETLACIHRHSSPTLLLSFYHIFPFRSLRFVQFYRETNCLVFQINNGMILNNISLRVCVYIYIKVLSFFIDRVIDRARRGKVIEKVVFETFHARSIKKSSFRTPRVNRTLLIAHNPFLPNDIPVFVSASLFLPHAVVIFNEGKSFRGSPPRFMNMEPIRDLFRPLPLL